MGNMSDGDLLLAAIREHPEEDTPRLVYADWLEENGQPDRAELIRLGVRACSERIDGRTRAGRRYRKLIKTAFAGINCVGWVYLDAESIPPPAYHPILGLERGMAKQFVGSPGDWLRHCAAVLAAHPIRLVWLTTEPDFGRAEERAAFAGMRHPDRSGETFVCDTFPGITFTLPA
jgi:uncharacterized protein (TIGR02996 family)